MSTNKEVPPLPVPSQTSVPPPTVPNPTPIQNAISPSLASVSANSPLTSTSLADALEDAQQRIAELLQHPDDLNSKMKMLQTKFANEKASIDVILKTSVQSQIDDTYDGLKLLSNSHTLVENVKSNLGIIHSICVDNRSDISNYPRIKKISRTHQNFHSTKEVVMQFQDLNKDIERISSLLDSDSRDILASGYPNLLYIHFHLFRLEEFRDATMHKAKSQGASVLHIVTKYFKRLDALSEKFKEHLWTISKNLINLIRENQGNVVVRLCKIIEVEEHADEMVLTNQQIRQSNQDLNSIETTSSGYEWKSMAVNPRTVKNYRSQMFQVILDQITLDFNQKIGPMEKSIVDSLQACNFVFDDLMLVFDEIGPRFPVRYKIFDFYVLQYHKQVYDLLNRLTKHLNLETRDILAMTSWVRDYYRVMGERFSVTEELLEPRLLDDKEDMLIKEYIRLIKVKLIEWANRLIEEEKAEFKKREKPPQVEPDGTFITDAIVIFFQMINQQIEIAIESARGSRLLLDVAIECFKTVEIFQVKQIKMIEEEEHLFLAGEELPGGFPEYVIAISNNHLKGMEYVETVQKRFETALDEKYRADALKYANESLEGFVKASKRGYTCLVNIIFKDISPAFAQLFTQSWYDQYQNHNSSAMASILHTLEDYLEDYKKHLADYLFTKLTTDCMDRFLMSYLECFKTKGIKFKMAQFPQFAKSDLQASITFWNNYKTPKRVKQSFDFIEKIIAVVESSDSMLFLSWYSLWKTYNDIPISFIEELLYKRDDLDKATVKETIANCKEKSKEPNTEATTSLYSKVYLPAGENPQK